MKNLITFCLFLLCLGCQEENKQSSLSADEIVNKSIEVSGGERFGSSEIKFDFRDKFYFAQRKQGNFLLARSFFKDNDSITDFLTNDEFKRLVGEDFIVVADSMITKYRASVNSVHYFSVLPYGLNDAAVNKFFLGEEEIKNKTYYKIKVTFNKEGGGEDFEDVFIYWIDKETFKVQYLAYSYNEDDGVGMRFREAFNERFIEGIRFVDYNNYKSSDGLMSLIDLGKLFEKNKLNLLSKIELKNIVVNDL
ncbi:DUF6503 family protein [Winogradskyella vincentii]|uniref:Deoxyribose-phosphate aldolase n=1 Tax=Winogradskyella vincentii TaxID=2877122 RepID=A0ABS7XYQ2_9FLAO|nr:DUF6503 family protein [Winogradskyella vincentii]MCA0152793.1 deoxyribose-phosphate aldolase [Winogradskyella vincentii]